MQGLSPGGQEAAGGHRDEGQGKGERSPARRALRDIEGRERETLEEIEKTDPEEGDVSEPHQAPGLAPVTAHPVRLQEEEAHQGPAQHASQHAEPTRPQAEADRVEVHCKILRETAAFVCIDSRDWNIEGGDGERRCRGGKASVV